MFSQQLCGVDSAPLHTMHTLGQRQYSRKDSVAAANGWHRFSSLLQDSTDADGRQPLVQPGGWSPISGLHHMGGDGAASCNHRCKSCNAWLCLVVARGLLPKALAVSHIAHVMVDGVSQYLERDSDAICMEQKVHIAVRDICLYIVSIW